MKRDLAPDPEPGLIHVQSLVLVQEAHQPVPRSLKAREKAAVEAKALHIAAAEVKVEAEVAAAARAAAGKVIAITKQKNLAPRPDLALVLVLVLEVLPQAQRNRKAHIKAVAEAKVVQQAGVVAEAKAEAAAEAVACKAKQAVPPQGAEVVVEVVAEEVEAKVKFSCLIINITFTLSLFFIFPAVADFPVVQLYTGLFCNQMIS